MTSLITKSTVYLGKNLFGCASKINCPVIDMTTEEIKLAFGSYNVNTAIKAMSSSLTLTSFDKDVFDKIQNPYSVLNFTVYGSLDNFENGALASSEQVKLVLCGTSQKFALLGDLEQQKISEYPIDFNISAIKLYIKGQEKLYIDIPNLIWRKNGVDMLSEIRKNLALN